MRGSSYFLEWGDYQTVVDLCACGADITTPGAAQCKACATRRQAERDEEVKQQVKLERHRAYKNRLRVKALIHAWWVSTG